MCTIATNVFLADKMETMIMKGGNSDELYKMQGRLKMARALERLWPGVVKTTRRWNRPQHAISGNWRKFNTKLIKKKGLKIENKPNEYGMKLIQVKEVKSQSLKNRFGDLLKDPKVKSKTRKGVNEKTKKANG
jgi:hypothetical protein